MDVNIGQDLVNLDFDFANESPVQCLLCDKNFEVVSDAQTILYHLLNIHRFVISSQEEIADFRQYLLYWQKLKYTRLEDYCVIITTNSEPGAIGKQENMFFLCDKLPEDERLRITLRETKLRFLTRQKEEECRNKEFSRVCIYCPVEIQGGIANSFHHLTFDHGFSLGNPDNIVFGARLLDILEDKLKKLQCLYCEKIFKNHVTLREHMRKKQHKSLNPKNKIYDKFYFLNYLKPGIPWEQAKKAVLEEQEAPSKCPEFDSISDDDTHWTDWREDSELSATCLFCPFTTSHIPSGIIHHMLDNHLFDFPNLTKKFSFYSKVKLVNYIRKKVKDQICIVCDQSHETNDDLINHMKSQCHMQLPDHVLWDQQRFMIPVIENDGILLYLDDDDIEDDDTSSTASFVDDEIVFPEEARHIPLNWRVLEEIEENSQDENCFCYQCLFCNYSKLGIEGRNLCISHMKSMHNFDFRAISKLETPYITLIINHIRSTTKKRLCFICNKRYVTRNALEEHRLLEGHTDITATLMQDYSRFETIENTNDGFILDCIEK